MSVKINSMSATTFTATPNGVTKPVTDNSTSAATTAFVKTFISTYLIPLASTLTVASTITFSTVYLTLLKGVSSLTLRGNLSIGGASTTVRLLGNTINVDANYPGILSCPNLVGSKIQAGYKNAVASNQVNTPIVPTAGSIVYASSTTTASSGIDSLNATGFLLRQTNRANWIMFN